MTYSVSNEEIELIAKELGLKVSFNSPTPGVLNTTTGKINHLNNYFGEFFQMVNEEKVVEIKELANMRLKTVKPKENEEKLNDFLVFTANYNILAG